MGGRCVWCSRATQSTYTQKGGVVHKSITFQQEAIYFCWGRPWRSFSTTTTIWDLALLEQTKNKKSIIISRSPPNHHQTGVYPELSRELNAFALAVETKDTPATSEHLRNKDVEWDMHIYFIYVWFRPFVSANTFPHPMPRRPRVYRGRYRREKIITHTPHMIALLPTAFNKTDRTIKQSPGERVRWCCVWWHDQWPPWARAWTWEYMRWRFVLKQRSPWGVLVYTEADRAV